MGNYMAITCLNIFQHELPRMSHEFIMNTIICSIRVQLHGNCMFKYFFNTPRMSHETCRRPTDQREVIFHELIFYIG